ncbi:MAG: LmbE family protein [Halobacteriovoraceae bacterium]|nr:LmbE family protein [Halobacteriovoraceae bacterium]|tara:strand:+ start:5569 stop:6213 length:645 start_codon:yes stop_codon:yes gene_type:complete
MIESFKKVLVLSPHTDDGELGAGGTIARLVEAGADVFYMAFSTAEESVPEGHPKDILVKEVKTATGQLGIKPENLIVKRYKVRNLNYERQNILEDLIEVRKNHTFDLVLMPSLNDIHQDHQTISQEGLRAFKRSTILGYELIWNNLSFNTTSFVEIKKEHLDRKNNALREYKSQEHRDYMSAEFINSLARTRGVQIGVEYAEAFEVIRLVMGKE